MRRLVCSTSQPPKRHAPAGSRAMYFPSKSSRSVCLCVLCGYMGAVVRPCHVEFVGFSVAFTPLFSCAACQLTPPFQP
eukprot:m.23804 g.23804  ORF g.23804 m.23804 type:complete len:78 (+) comp7296_c0_seq1:71-304(+)